MSIPGLLWPTANMDFWMIKDKNYQVDIIWTHNHFDDYQTLSNRFYECGYQVFSEVVESGHDNTKSDMWFLCGIFLIRQSMELGIKALLCRECSRKKDIEDAFEYCCHDLSKLWETYVKSCSKYYLNTNEHDWLKSYLTSLEIVDKKSDMFRFPFEDDFLSQYRDKFIDNVDVANNMLQAYTLIKKSIECGCVAADYLFDDKLSPEFFVMASHGIGNCYLWQSVSDNGFHVKVTGYIAVSDFLMQNETLPCISKAYPVIFMLRNTIELCLKRLFFSGVNNGVSQHAFFSKRKSHLIKKDLWSNVKPMILYYANEQGQETGIIDTVEQKLLEINDIDKKGDMFRYPTSYSLEYRFDKKKLDLKNVYEYMQSLINFLDGCDSMLDQIACYENEMRSYYE